MFGSDTTVVRKKRGICFPVGPVNLHNRGGREIEAGIKKIMKKILGICVATFISVAMFAQHSYNPPTAVVNGFHKTYPKSEAGQWSHTSTGWSVTFDDRDHDNGEAVAHFDKYGRHRDTYIPYDNNDVPSNVMERVQKKYPGDDYEFTHIERRSGGNLYKVRMRHHNRYKTFYVDEHGNYKQYHANY